MSLQHLHYGYYAEINLKWRQWWKGKSVRKLLFEFMQETVVVRPRCVEGGVEKWSDSEEILKEEPTGFACILGD